MHYGNTDNEPLEVRVTMLEKFEVRLFELMTFFEFKRADWNIILLCKDGSGFWTVLWCFGLESNFVNRFHEYLRYLKGIKYCSDS